MGITGTERTYNGLTVSYLSDLSGIDEANLAVKLLNPRAFTLGEVAELAPHLGVTVDAYIAAVLA